MPLLNLIPDGYVVNLYYPYTGGPPSVGPTVWALCPTWASAVAAANACEAYVHTHDASLGVFTIQIVPSLRTRQATGDA